MIPFEKIRTSGEWTLFLDRDGVINQKLPGTYVTSWQEFKFLPRALEAIKYFSQIFNHIVVVTNQQGIGKEIMTAEQLNNIHQKMADQIIDQGGYIDQIYYCPHLAIEDPMCRKPNPGMAFQAAEDFENIDFKKSLMIGDSLSDMEFGNKLGMYTILINSSSSLGGSESTDIINMQMPSLHEVATYLMHC